MSSETRPDVRVHQIDFPAPAPMSGDPVRFGILGAARICRRLVPAIQESPLATLVGVACREEERAREKATEWGQGCRAFASYEALLASPDIDAVYIPLPNGLHAEWCERALGAGKMVMCEKSLVATPADLARVKKAVDATGGWLEETFQYRWHPLTAWASKLVQSGGLGKLASGAAQFVFELEEENIRWSRPLGGGASFDIGAYCVGIYRELLGEEPVSAIAEHCVWSDDGDGEVDAEFIGRIGFASGLECSIGFSYQRPLKVRWALSGDKATLQSPHDFAYNVHDEQPVQELLLFPGPADELNPWRDRATEPHERFQTPAVLNCYQLMLDDCCRRWRAKQPPRWGVADAAKNLSALWALLESSRKRGKAVEVGSAG